MITIEHEGKTNFITGLSTDTKPLLNSKANGSIFYEMDTGKVFMYNEEDNEWLEQ